MTTQQKHFHLKQTLPTELNLTEGEQQQKDKFSLHRKFYDTFAFRDRITNNRFQYKQAREKRLIKIIEWEAPEIDVREELKDSLNVYKFTKNFEINCIRTKYLQQSQGQKSLKLKENHCKTAVYGGQGHKFMSKEALFQINKQEMKRVLQTNDHVNRDIIALNKSKRYLPFHLKSRNIKKNTLKWKIIDANSKDHDSLQMQGEAERRITEKIINHMKHEIKSNCEYLLNMPTEKKKQALFKSQLKRHLENHKTSFPNYSHSELSAYEFATLQIEENANAVTDEELNKQDEEANTLLKFVKMGFVNEVYLQLKNNPYYCLAKDQADNNVYHIAAKQGNTEMSKILLKVIGPRNTLRLLSDKNHMKRTPHDKAKLLGHRDISTLFELFTAENKHIIC